MNILKKHKQLNRRTLRGVLNIHNDKEIPISIYKICRKYDLAFIMTATFTIGMINSQELLKNIHSYNVIKTTTNNEGEKTNEPET